MTYNDLTTNDEIELECADFDDDCICEPIDELHHLASAFAALSASDNIPARHRRVCDRLADACDAGWLLKGKDREAFTAAVHNALAQLEKALSAEVRSLKRSRH